MNEMNFEHGCLSRQFELAAKYYKTIPQWKKDMIHNDD